MVCVVSVVDAQHQAHEDFLIISREGELDGAVGRRACFKNRIWQSEGVNHLCDKLSVDTGDEGLAKVIHWSTMVTTFDDDDDDDEDDDDEDDGTFKFQLS